MPATLSASTSVGVCSKRVPSSLAGWAAHFEPKALPVLSETAAQLEALRTLEESVDAHTLAEVVADDPLMSLKVMAHVAALRPNRESGEPESLTGALVMLGIPPFFAAFPPQVGTDQWFSGQPDALSGFSKVLLRSHRAARFAIAFAVHRLDRDAAVIHQAALLHDFAELLLWLEFPELAREIVRRLALAPGLRSSVAQREVLGVELNELQHALMLRWRLPALLAAFTDDHSRRETAQQANVRLAVRVARHSACGWENPALPDDYADIGRLLQLNSQHVQALLADVDA